MKLIKDQQFGGERPLFATHDLRLENVTITDGESGIKQCQRMEAYDCKFYGKYPWWHVDGAKIDNCYFALGSRSAIWYTNDLVMTNSRIDGPKFFCEMKNLTLENLAIPDVGTQNDAFCSIFLQPSHKALRFCDSNAANGYHLCTMIESNFDIFISLDATTKIDC